MPAKINLINQKIGKLIVIDETSKRKHNSVVWRCECECGNIIELSTKELRNDGIISCKECGNDRQPKIHITENIVGNTYNNLTVLEKTNKKSGGKILYKCQCNCQDKNIIYVNRTDLINGHTKSCGCIARKFKPGDIINNRKILSITNKKYNNRAISYFCECLLCSRKYSTSSSNLQHTFSCGCQKSLGEFNIIQILEKNQIKYKKEYIFPNTQFKYDFALLDNNNNIIRLIEFDGEQHYIEGVKNTGWNTIKKYKHTKENDLKKEELAKNNNIPLVRIPYWERDNITLQILLEDKYLIK